MTEKTLQNQFRAFLKRNQIFHIKINDRFLYGVPDLYILLNGRSIWIELKTESGKLSKLQERMIKKINDSGGEAYIVRSLADLIGVIGG